MHISVAKTDAPQNPPGWLFQVEDHEGDPFARFIMVRIPDAEEAGRAVAAAVNEKVTHLVRNLLDSEVAGMQPGEIRPFNP